MFYKNVTDYEKHHHLRILLFLLFFCHLKNVNPRLVQENRWKKWKIDVSSFQLSSNFDLLINCFEEGKKPHFTRWYVFFVAVFHFGFLKTRWKDKLVLVYNCYCAWRSFLLLLYLNLKLNKQFFRFSFWPRVESKK